MFLFVKVDGMGPLAFDISIQKTAAILEKKSCSVLDACPVKND